MGSLLLPHIASSAQLNQSLRFEASRLVVIHFGNETDIECMRQDDVLARTAPFVKSYAVIYTCEVQHAGEVAAQFEIASGDMCIMFFWRGKHVKCDLGTGDNEKTTWVVGKQEMIDIVEVVCRGARKGRGQVDGPRDYATRGRW